MVDHPPNPTSDDSRVADAPTNIWVYRLLPRPIWPYAQLARWDRPIGWWLLLWPCWWSLALALINNTDEAFVRSALFHPPFVLLILVSFGLFWLGAVAMRGAGCTYNDLVDVDIDVKVSRTASRPIPSGRVTSHQARLFMLLQAGVGAIVLFALCWLGGNFNTFALMLGVASLVIIAAYPFAKRVTDWPQFVLGLAFSWGALMGWAVTYGELAWPAYLLYAGSILWVIGYDTIYAHQDREDDALVGVRSTALLFGEKTKPALMILYSSTLVLFALAFGQTEADWPSYLGLLAGAGHMVWQLNKLDIEDADQCLRLFQSNSHFGWILFTGLLIDLII